MQLYYGENYGSGECSGGVAADEADKLELIHNVHNKYLLQTYDSILGPRNMHQENPGFSFRAF